MDKTIIRLSPQHRTAAVETLAAAFSGDPAMAYMMPDAADRQRRLPKLIGWMFDDHLVHGVVLGTPGAEVVTLWRPPGMVHVHAPLTPRSIWRFLGILGPAILRAERVDRAIGRHLPPAEDWFYLRMAGVRPDRQGQGLGGLAIRAGLELAAERGVPSVLETATERNVGLYLRLGYNVISEWDVSRRGPHFWTMTT
ncbi:GNAT family N-acetyltransferase [Novosphingobium sp. KCTC 2891]|uniref:GNAT family N-acetyltransferase n=1 Tax=Novosphingobium sp. KCTC 2891 TaxID=2989730 RepID=UPI0022238953|nr:GNAT family N-acetyltransferase [Novosphingobium sp. KCTC 2891]MCW1384249.1 GNAT family N-acetyltransferase [Novosphingobium sp. KCTC 2891]